MHTVRDDEAADNVGSRLDRHVDSFGHHAAGAGMAGRLEGLQPQGRPLEPGGGRIALKVGARGLRSRARNLLPALEQLQGVICTARHHWPFAELAAAGPLRHRRHARVVSNRPPVTGS